MVPPALAEHGPVRPGDFGAIELTVQNTADQTGETIEDLSFLPIAPADFVINNPASVLGPVSIPPGGSFTFKLAFSIAPQADDAAFAVTLKAVLPPYVELEGSPSDLDTLVNIIRKRPRSLDEPA